MSDRPTPETDAAASPHIGFYSCATVTAGFARNLERERDEARAGREAYKQLAVKHAQDRDEAREDRKNSRQSLAVALEELNEARDETRKSKAYKRVLKETNARLKRERDEARKEAHRFRALHYSHLGINGSASWFPWEEKLGHE